MVAASQLRNEENARQRCVKHTAHHSSHAQQGIVGGRNGNSEKLVIVPHLCKDKAADAAQEQTGSERTTTTSTAVSGSRCKHLEENDERQKEQKVF